MITDQDTEKFQALYKDSLGISITKEQATEELLVLVNVMKLVYKPITQEELDSINKLRKNNT